MKRLPLIAALPSMLSAGGCAGPTGSGAPPPAQAVAASAEEQMLMDADRAFDRDTATRGAEGWASYFAPYGSMQLGADNPIVGPQSIREAMAGVFGRPGVSLRWEPTAAGIAVPGRLGFTTGRYESRRPGPDGGETVSTGRYLSVWRRQEDGTWKVVFDTGEVDAPPAPSTP